MINIVRRWEGLQLKNLIECLILGIPIREGKLKKVSKIQNNYEKRWQ